MDGAHLAKLLTGGGRRIHLIGVAGSGMSGIAGLCMALGHRVSGSDKATTIETDRLQTLGLDFSSPANPEKVRDSELVIFSSAIKPAHWRYHSYAGVSRQCGGPGADRGTRYGEP